MIRFNKFGGARKKLDPTNAKALFESLDRQQSHATLRPVQTEAMEVICGQRRGERDLVLKLSTGGGKTTTGLIYLWSHAVESKRPVVYLCPTTQLVQQVLAEARRLGIPAHHYEKGQSIPAVECTAGEAVLVCTYEKLFNARSTFDRNDVNMRPVALVL
ncbi:MAG: DEAD/DEAH box helicase, partial [Polyangiaceae bacterium]|nr:DEAD/DEAH box helicase [Polyangiaceae bacterium]